MILYGHDEALALHAARHLDVRAWGKCRALGVVRGTELVAIAVYGNYRHPNIEMSIWSATPRWATREAISALLRYPFLQLGVSRITATTDAMNPQARAFLCRIGFTLEGTHPAALPNGNTALTYGLLRADAARWLAEGLPCPRAVQTPPRLPTLG